jgi:hypothetical protein
MLFIPDTIFYIRGPAFAEGYGLAGEDEDDSYSHTPIPTYSHTGSSPSSIFHPQSVLLKPEH